MATKTNHFLLCRWGQEYVHEIVNKTVDMFNFMRRANVSDNRPWAVIMEEKMLKVRDTQETIEQLFQKIKQILMTLEKESSNSEYIEGDKLIPYKVNPDSSSRTVPDADKVLDGNIMEEHARHLAAVKARNHHLKTIIDQLRDLVWDINTMLAMRGNTNMSCR
ncbi:mediator complex subunit 30 [Brevipalpus obovatus]|uniref:mediator complex subunit 30 n=1 Tax=Brevipalpus obovatus TaxID=246614 RepID=UPI003D9EAB25